MRVRKWTRKLNLFEKDYIFIPVNFSLHWSLVVICHPGEVANFKDEDKDKALKVPCILHMDSIKGTHTGLKNHVQSYLWEEWKERQNEASEEMSSKFFNLRFVPLELPQQENSFDCGLFLLHYAELFLEEAPLNFNPFKITKFSNFLSVDWFPPAEASLKRALIQRIIYELLENCPREISPAACSEEQQSSKFVEHNNENETDVEFLSERCSPAKACHGNLLSCRAGQGIEMTLLAASSVRSSEFVNDSSMVLREFFEPGATTGSLLEGQYPPFDETTSFCQLKGAMPQLEEDTETGEHFAYSPPGRTGSRPMDGITPLGCSVSYSSRGFGAQTSWLAGISMEQEHEDVDSSPETSICASDDSLDAGIIEDSPVREDVGPSQKENTDLQGLPSMENIECFTESLASASSEMQETTVFEDLQNPDKIARKQ
ncbi:hypothetical protein L1049_026830 [Liquidambar formosana]|uniref:Ubiquitin-like protease family profile domain-containing protein n=1 Tax=Liquidambar formosana TaxID=63359 RepID=A0AAP0NE26_LIQFO